MLLRPSFGPPVSCKAPTRQHDRLSTHFLLVKQQEQQHGHNSGQVQRDSALETLKDESAGRMALARAEVASVAAAAAADTGMADDGLAFDLFGGRHVVTTEAFAHPAGAGVGVKRPYNPHARYQPAGSKRARNVTTNTNATTAPVANTGTGNDTRTSVAGNAKATTSAAPKGSSGSASTSTSTSTSTSGSTSSCSSSTTTTTTHKASSAGGDWSSWFPASADADASVGVGSGAGAGADPDMLSSLSAKGRLTVVVTAEAVSELVEACESKHSVVALALVWSDLSTTHDTSTVKHCVGAAPCSRPFCACHRTVRASIAYKPLLGTVIQVQVGGGSNGNHQQQQSQQQQRQTFFLPLTATTDDDDQGHWVLHYDTAFAHLPARLTLPRASTTTSLARRWHALHDIIYGPSTTLVYSAQRLLLGVMHAMSTHPMPRVRAAAGSGSPKNLFDARVACYLCNPELKEKELELSELLISLSVPESGVFGTCTYPDQGRSCGLGLGRGAVSSVLEGVAAQLTGLHTAYATIKARLAVMNGSMVMQRIEMPLVGLLAQMEQRGMALVPKTMHQVKRDLGTAITAVTAEIHASTGSVFNVASNDDVGRVLFTSLALPVQGTTATNKPQVGEEVLSKLQHMHPAVSSILDFRRLAKLRGLLEGSFMDKGVALGPLTVAQGQGQGPGRVPRIHPIYHQTQTGTGRLSASQPNIQQVPKESSRGVGLRNCLQAQLPRTSTGTSDFLVAADYSQIEMRVLADLAGDTDLIRLFNEDGGGGDVYRKVAASIFSRPSADEVSPAERKQAKVVVLAQMYGQGEAAAAADLGVTVAVFRRVKDAFHAQFRALRPWMALQKRRARESGFAETKFGRRRLLPHIDSSSRALQALAERQAVNSPVQGTASDVIKFAMLLVENDMPKDATLSRVFGGAGAGDSNSGDGNSGGGSSASVRSMPRLVCSIHDELVYEVPGDVPGAVPAFAHFLRRCMADKVGTQLGFKVPLSITVEVGMQWGDMRVFDFDAHAAS